MSIYCFFKVIFLFVSRPANIIFLVHTYDKIKNGISHTCVLRVLSFPLNLVMVRRRKVCKSLSKKTLYTCSSDWKRQTVYFLLHSDSANFLCQNAAWTEFRKTFPFDADLDFWRILCVFEISICQNLRRKPNSSLCKYFCNLIYVWFA